LKNEQETMITVQGLGNMTATAKGNLIVENLQLGTALRVPELGINLISEGQLQTQGCEIVSKGKWRKVYLKGKLLIEATLEKGLFIWKPKDQNFLKDQNCFLAGAKPNSNKLLWHLRMGHLNGEDLQKLQHLSTGMGELEKGSLPFCQSCCRAKGTMRSFKGHGEHATSILETIYIDLWGPMQQSMTGCTYALLVVDEFSSYTWGYFLQNKAQAAQCIMQFIKEQDRSGNKVIKIRSDRGGEFSSAHFKEFLQQLGIQFFQSPSFTPQFQGKVERMNRTVGEMAHAMRVGAGLNLSFWQLAWETAIFLRNRSPTSSNSQNATPYEIFYDKKPRLENLLIFGSKAEIYINEAQRKKGNDRTKPGIFVGYDESSKSYKFLPNGENRWVSTRTIFCDERTLGENKTETSNWDLLNSAANDIVHPQIAEAKENDRPLLTAAKSTRRITRAQLQHNLDDHLAMMVVDDLGGEIHVPGEGINLNTPKTISQAFSGVDADKWKQAVQEEMDSINEAQVLSDAVQLPHGEKATGLKFIFVKKVGEDGQINRYKARLVYNHYGKESNEDNYSPVANRVTLRIFLATTAGNKWKLKQADVKTAFLNAENPGKEFVRLPREIVDNETDRIRQLNKALYGLQRAPKMWHKTFTDWVKQIGYKPSEHDSCWFIHKDKPQMILIYVDDMLLAAKDDVLLDEMYRSLNEKFKSRLIGVPTYFLGMNVYYDADKGLVQMSQKTYIEAIVEKFNFGELLPRTLPMGHGLILTPGIKNDESNIEKYGSLIGALLFLAVSTRPDIAFPVGVLSRFVSCSNQSHWDAAVDIIRYLKGTKTKGIILGKLWNKEVTGYADSDWASDVNDRISISGGMVFWGDSLISWFSRKQNMVCLSTAEAETHALVDLVKEITYVRRLIKDIANIFQDKELVTSICYSDNQPAIDAILGGKGRTKYYDLRIKYLAAQIGHNEIAIEKISTADNLADALTKPLRTTRFRMLMAAIISNSAN
jgi:hypothetical protein